MREFELYGTVRAAVSVCDSVNYITEPEELLQVFRLVNNYLDPGGIFLFDLNTLYKYEKILGESVIAENRDEGSFIWENWYDPEDRINEYDLTLFIREEKDLYRKYQETHFQRAYSIEEIRGCFAMRDESGGDLGCGYAGEALPPNPAAVFYSKRAGKITDGVHRSLKPLAGDEPLHPL